jgi:hypothetical protein
MESPPKFLAFGLDPGEESGWGIAINPEYPLEFGTASTIATRKEVCLLVVGYSVQLQLPIVVFVEEWTAGGPQATYKMYVGLGKNYGRWLDHIELIIGVSESDIVRVTPQKWRNGLFGEAIRKYCQKPDVGVKLKKLACAYVSPTPTKLHRNHNAAEAACIACWGHCSEEGMDASERAIRRYAFGTD